MIIIFLNQVLLVQALVIAIVLAITMATPILKILVLVMGH